MYYSIQTIMAQIPTDCLHHVAGYMLYKWNFARTCSTMFGYCKTLVTADDITNHRWSWNYPPIDVQWDYHTPGIEYNKAADWQEISKYRPLTPKFINGYAGKLQWEIVCHRHLPDQILQKYLHYIYPEWIVDCVEVGFILRNLKYFGTQAYYHSDIETILEHLISINKITTPIFVASLSDDFTNKHIRHLINGCIGCNKYQFNYINYDKYAHYFADDVQLADNDVHDYDEYLRFLQSHIVKTDDNSYTCDMWIVSVPDIINAKIADLLFSIWQSLYVSFESIRFSDMQSESIVDNHDRDIDYDDVGVNDNIFAQNVETNSIIRRKCSLQLMDALLDRGFQTSAIINPTLEAFLSRPFVGIDESSNILKLGPCAINHIRKSGILLTDIDRVTSVEILQIADIRKVTEISICVYKYMVRNNICTYGKNIIDNGQVVSIYYYLQKRKHNYIGYPFNC